MNVLTFCALTPLNPLSKSKVSIVTSHPISLVKVILALVGLATLQLKPIHNISTLHMHQDLLPSSLAFMPHHGGAILFMLAYTTFGYACQLIQHICFQMRSIIKNFHYIKNHCFYIYSIVTTLIVKSRLLLQND